MKVHLIRSENVSMELLEDVADILRSVTGPLQFVTDTERYLPLTFDRLPVKELDVEEFEKSEVHSSNIICSYDERSFPLSRSTARWEIFFRAIVFHRKTFMIHPNEFIILLTDIANDQNWFGALDDKNRFNAFIHTDDWDHFLKVNPAFPVAYTVLSKVLEKHMFQDAADMLKGMHHKTLGCMNDFCEQKTDIIMKLRTADICQDCYRRILGKIDPVIYHQCKAIMERLRIRMLFNQNFNQNFNQDMPASPMLVNRQNKIILSAYQEIEVNLRPLEKAIYFLYLRHPEGITLTNLVDHEEELKFIYGQLATTGMLTDIHHKVKSLTDVLSNSASEKISRIKKVFEKSIGETLSRQYIIQGANGECKKILFDRSLLSWEDGNPILHLNGQEKKY